MHTLVWDEPITEMVLFASRRHMDYTGQKVVRWVRHMPSVTAVTNIFRLNEWTQNRLDPDGLIYLAKVSVWGRWSISAICIFLLIYRPLFELSSYRAYIVLLLILMASNGYIHYRLASKKTMTLQWVLALSVMDVILITVAVGVSGFQHFLFFMLYYPALAIFALVFTSFKLNLAWVTIVSIAYAVVSVSVNGGLDLDLRDDKVLISRIMILYVVSVSVNLVSGFERIRWRQAIERERALQRERIELSQSIHDTMAQSAYMMGLGIDTAMHIAGDSNKELTSTLQATSQLSRSAMWDLRHPIDIGRIFEGRELSRALGSHVETFTTITSVPAEIVRTGEEPPLSTEAKRLLFAIAHNALTNAYRHAQASHVNVELAFEEDGVRLSVADDGIGLPPGYAERGHGFENMGMDAKRLGGNLLIESGIDGVGTTVTCEVRYARSRGENPIVIE